MLLGFLPNYGQVCNEKGEPLNDIHYHTQFNGVSLYFRNNTVSYLFPKKQLGKDKYKSYYCIDFQLIGSNSSPTIISQKPILGSPCYYISNLGSAIIPAYSEIIYQNIYPNIDLIWRQENNHLKYEFLVHPGANPQNIRIRYVGATKVKISKNGNLIIQNPEGEIQEYSPYSYYKGTSKKLATAFRVEGDIISFDLPQNLDPTQTLVIDPLVWASYYGGSGAEEAFAVATHQATGKVAIAGVTYSSNFPTQTQPGQYVQAVRGQGDAFVAMFDANGNRLWATYLGGTATDEAHDLTFDATGNLIVVGRTRSSDFPTTLPAFGGGGYDIFCASFSNNGTLQWARTIGGAQDEQVYGVATNSAGEIFICGTTPSNNFPAVSGQPTSFTQFNGIRDAFIVKLNALGVPQWTYLFGGSAADEARDICVDPFGNIYITGLTLSNNLPVTSAFQSSNGGATDAFIASFTANANLNWSTYLGGSQIDVARAIAYHPAGNVVLAGNTNSNNFPAGGSNIASFGGQSYNGGGDDAFVALFNASNGNRIWSAFYGGGNIDQAHGIAVDLNGNILISGYTQSSNFNTTSGSNQYTQTLAGGQDAFVVQFTPAANRTLAFLYGGSGNAEIANDLAILGNTLWLTGKTNSANLPRPTNSIGYSQQYSGGDDAFLAAFSIPCNIAAPIVRDVARCGAGDIVFTVTLDNTSGGNKARLFTQPTGGIPIFVDDTAPFELTVNLTQTTTFYIEAYDDRTECSSSRVAVVGNVIPLPATPVVGSQALCAPGVFTFTVTVENPQQSQVRLFNAINSTIPIAIDDTPPFELSTGFISTTSVFYIEAVNQRTGCTSERAEAIVIILPAIPAPFVTASAACLGKSLSFTVANPAPGAIYVMQTPDGLQQASTTGTFTRPVVSLSMAGVYSFSTIIGACSSALRTISVEVFATPNPPLATNSSPICSGDNLQLSATLSGIQNASYFWQGPGGYSSTLQNPTIFSATSAVNGFYSVAVVVNGCTSDFATTQVRVNELPLAPSVSSNSPVCVGQTLLLTAELFLGARYEWEGPNGFSATINNPSIPNVTTAANGTYRLRIFQNGCYSRFVTTQVDVRGVAVAINSNSPVCEGGILNLTATDIPGASYEWSGPNGIRLFGSTAFFPGITLNDAGLFTLRVTQPGCGAQVLTTVVQVNQGVQNLTISSNSPLCIGGQLNLTAPTIPNATYFWTGPNGFSSALQNPTIAGVTLEEAGVYSVRIRIPGCPTPPNVSTNVVINQPPRNVAAQSNSPVCEGGVLNLTATFIPGAIYEWSGPGYTSNIHNPVIQGIQLNQAGIYNVTVTAPGCPPVVASTQVVVAPSPTPIISPVAPLCSGSTLQITTTFIAGARYSWIGPNNFTSTSFAVSKGNVTTADAGVYNVTITNPGCGTTQLSVNVIINDAPQVVIDAPSVICEGNSLQLVATAINVPGVRYTWSGPAGFASNDPSPTRNNVVSEHSGTYAVTVSVPGCNPSTATANVTVNAAPNLIASSNSPVCIGEQLVISANDIPAASYRWIGPGGTQAATRFITIPAAAASNAGIYSVTANVPGCPSASATVAVVISNPPLNPNPTSNATLVCAGRAIALSANGEPNHRYNWSGPGGFTSQAQNPTIPSVTTNASGTYFVTVTSPGCPPVNGSVTITVNDPPATPVILTNSPVCTGGILRFTITNPASNATYTWTGPNNFSATGSSVVLNSVALAFAGRYRVVARTPGCEADPKTAETDVVINATSEVAPTNNTPICVGQTLELRSNAPTGATVSWSGPGNFSSPLPNPTVTNAQLSNAGIYTVVIRTPGCPDRLYTLDVVISQSVTAQTVNVPSICVGTALSLSAPSVSTLPPTYLPQPTYSWNGPAGFSSTLQNPIITSAGTVNSGIYVVTISAAGCPTIQRSYNVVVNEAPSDPQIPSQVTLCKGQSLQLVAASSTGTFNWSAPDGLTATGATFTRPSMTPQQSGVYSLTVSVEGCAPINRTTSVIVNEPPVGIPVVSTGGRLAYCTNDLLALNIPATPNALYQWNGPAGFTSTLQNPTRRLTSTTMSGIYSVTVQVPGCAPVLATTPFITVSEQPVVQITTNSPICERQTLNLIPTAIVGATYTWSGQGIVNPALVNQSIPNFSATGNFTYNLSVTVPGCPEVNTSVNVTVNPRIPDFFIDGANVVCEGSLLTLTPSSVFNYPGIKYLWEGPNNFTATTIQITRPAVFEEAGIYTLTITLPGCTTIAQRFVQVGRDPNTVQITTNSPICEGQNLILSASSLPSAFYSWSGPGISGAFLQSVTLTNRPVTPPGGLTYTLTVNTNGCPPAIKTVTVHVNRPVPATNTLPTVNACQDANLSLNTYLPSDLDTDARLTWYSPQGAVVSATLSQIQPNQAGNYRAVVEIPGCNTGEFILPIRIAPNPAKITSPRPTINACDKQSITLSVNNLEVPLTQGPPGNFTWEWRDPNNQVLSSNVNTLNIPNPTSGNYSLVINTTSTCATNPTIILFPVSVAPTFTITQPNLPYAFCQGATVDLNNLFYQSNPSLQNLPPPNLPVNLRWYNNNNNVIPGGTLINVTSVNSGDYYAEVFNTPGCTPQIFRVRLNIIPNPANITVPVRNFCLVSGAQLELLASEADPVLGTYPGTSYNWLDPQGNSIGTTPTIRVTPTQAGLITYRLSIDVPGCSPATINYPVQVNIPPDVPSATGPACVTTANPACEGTPVTLRAFCSGPPAGTSFKYTWNGPAGITELNRYNETINFNSLPAGTHTFSVLVSSDGCAGRDQTYTVQVTIGKRITTSPFAAPQVTVCQASGTTYILRPENLPVDINTKDVQYIWTQPGGSPQASSNSTLSITLNPDRIGVYSLQIQTPGCSPSSNFTVNLRYFEPLQSPTLQVTPQNFICPGQDFTLRLANLPSSWSNNVPSDVSIRWFRSDDFEYTTARNRAEVTLSNNLTNAVISGSFRAEIIVPNCGTYNVRSNPITILSAPTIVLSTNANNNTICVGETLTINATISLPAFAIANYEWRGPNGFTATTLAPAVSRLIQSGQDAGDYTLTVNIAGNPSGCNKFESTPIRINVREMVVAGQIQVNPTAICQGEQVTLTFRPTQPANFVNQPIYSWLAPNGNPVGGNAASITDSPVGSGFYTLTVSNAGCIPRSFTVPIKVFVRPSINLVSEPVGSICAGNTLRLTATPAPGSPSYELEYEWSAPGGLTLPKGVNQNTAVVNNITTQNSGAYTVRATNTDPDAPAACKSSIAQSVDIRVIDRVIGGTVRMQPSQNPNYVCEGSEITFRFEPNPPVSNLPVGTTFEWRDGNGVRLGNLTGQEITIRATASLVGPLSVVALNPGCANSTTAQSPTFRVLPLPTLSLNPGGALTACEGTEIRLRATTNLTALGIPVQYQWQAAGITNPPSGSELVIPSVTTANTGAHTLRATVQGAPAACQTAEATVSLTVIPKPDARINGSPIVCANTPLELTAAVDNPAFRYAWFRTTQSIRGEVIGTSRNLNFPIRGPQDNGFYCLIVESSFPCAAETSCVQVDVGGVSGLQLQPTATSVLGGNRVCVGQAVRLSVAEVPGAISYRWRVAGNNNITGREVTYTPVSTSDNTFTVEVTVNGCSQPITATTNISVVQAPAPRVQVQPNPVCAGSDVTLAIDNLQDGIRYEWRGPGIPGGTPAVDNVYRFTAPVGATNPLKLLYNLSAIAAPGCTANIVVDTIFVYNRNWVPQISANPNTRVLCEGTSLTLSVSNVPLGAIYNWSGPLISDQSLPTQRIAALPAGNHVWNVELSLPGGVCGNLNPLTYSVTVNKAVQPTPRNSGPICLSANQRLDLTAFGTGTLDLPQGSSVQWFGPRSNTQIQGATTQTPFVQPVRAEDAGTYRVQIDIPGCGRFTGTTEVVVSGYRIPEGTTPNIIYDGPKCQGQPLRFTVTNISPADYPDAVFTYRDAGGNIITTKTGAGANELTANAPTAGGTYTVEVRTPCSSSPAIGNISVDVLPTPRIQDDIKTVCAGSPVVLDARNTAANATFDYRWQELSGSFSSTLEKPEISTNITLPFNPSNPRIIREFEVTVSARANAACSAKARVQVVIDRLPSSFKITSNAPRCAGQQLQLTVDPAVAGATYTWTLPNANRTLSPNPTNIERITLNNITTQDAGLYSVQVELGACLERVVSEPIIINEAITNLRVVPLQPVCEGNSFVLTAEPLVPGATYTWVGPGFGPQVTPSNTITINNAQRIFSSSPFTVTVNVAGCSPTTATIPVTVNPGPGRIVLSTNPNTQPICPGTKVDFLLTLERPIPGVRVNWFFRPANQTQPRAVNGWTGISQSINAAQPSNSGQYFAAIIYPGCDTVFSNAVELTVLAPPPASVTFASTPAQPVCPGANLILTANPANVNYRYTWITPRGDLIEQEGQNGNILEISGITAQQAGDYTVEVRDINDVGKNCPARSASFQVRVRQVNPLRFISQPPSAVCEGENISVRLENPTPGATYSWSFIASPGNPPGTPPTGQFRPTPGLDLFNVQGSFEGLYTLTETAGPGCTQTISFGLTVNQRPVLQSSNATRCSGETVTLNVNPTWGPPNATPPAPRIGRYTFNWVKQGGTPFTSSELRPVISGLTPDNSGKYLLTVSTPGCQDVVAEFNLTVHPNPSVTVLADKVGPYCDGETVTLIATTNPPITGATYTWLNATNQTVASGTSNSYSFVARNTTAGNYTVRITQPTTPTTPPGPAAACTTSGSIAVQVNQPVVLTLGTVNNLRQYCAGGTITFTVTPSGANPPVNTRYFWSGPSGVVIDPIQTPTLSNITQANSGTYTMEYEIPGCGRFSAGAVTLQVLPAITASIEPIGPLCVGSSLALTPVSNINLNDPSVNINWSGPNNFTSTLRSPVISAVRTQNAGIYTLTITRQGCLPGTFTFPVTINSVPNAGIKPEQKEICTGATLSFEVDANKNTTAVETIPFATYRWSGPGGFNSTERNVVINNVDLNRRGTYSVIVSIPGCRDTLLTHTVEQIIPQPVLSLPSRVGPICEGQTVQLTVTGGPQGINTYIWKNPNALQLPCRSADCVISTPISGTYTVELDLEKPGCTVARASTEVIVNPRPKEPGIQSPRFVCNNSQLSLAANPSPSTSTKYIWNVPGGRTYTIDNNAFVNIPAADVRSGIYTLTVEVEGCPPLVSTFEVRQVNRPTISLPPSVTLCEGQPFTLEINPPVAGATYAWSGPNNFSASTALISIPSVTTASQGDYRVRVSLVGCGDFDASTNLRVNRQPTRQTITANTPICAGIDLQLGIPGQLGASYQWAGPGGFTSTEQNPRVPAERVQTGQYVVTTSVPQCSSRTDTINVLRFDPSIVQVAPVPPICKGGTIELKAPSIPGAGYIWRGPGIRTGTINTNPTLNISQAEQNFSGRYSLEVSLPGCGPVTRTIDVVVNDPVEGLRIINNSPYCSNSEVSLVSQATKDNNSAIYEWSIPAGSAKIQGRIISLPRGSAPQGIYTLTVSVPGCTAIVETTEVKISPLPVDPRPVVNSPACEGSILNFIAAGVAGTSFTWTAPDGRTTYTQQNIQVPATTQNSGVWQVTASSPGCPSVTSTVSAVVNKVNGTPAIVASSPVCVGGSVNLRVEPEQIGGTTYSWVGPNNFSSNLVTPTISNLTTNASGAYSVTITVPGCQPVQVVGQVLVNNAINLSAIQNNYDFCQGSTISIAAPNIDGATYIWTLPNGTTQNNPTLNVAATSNNAGSYSLRVNVPGCGEATRSFTIRVNERPQSINLVYADNICLGNSQPLTAPEFVTGTTYAWSGPASFSSTNRAPVVTFDNLNKAGVYTVIVTVPGCLASSATANIKVNTPPPSFSFPSSVFLCEGQSQVLSGPSVPEATYSWEVPSGAAPGGNNPNYNLQAPNVRPGRYRLTVNVPGCAPVTASTEVLLIRRAERPIVSTNSPVCVGGALNLTVTNEQPGVTYRWNGPGGWVVNSPFAERRNITLADEGTYQVIATAAGCNAETTNVDIVVNAAPSIPNFAPIEACERSSFTISAPTFKNATYSWNGPAGEQSSQNYVRNDARITDSGIYSLTISVPGCSSVAGSVQVTVNRPLPTDARATSNSPACEGGALSLSVTGVARATYSWSGPYAFDPITRSQQTPILNNITTANSGRYTVRVQVPGCSDVVLSTDVVINALPPINIVTNSPVCEGNNILLTATAVNGAQYTWSGRGVTPGVNRNAISIVAAPASTGGNYTVEVEVQGCGRRTASAVVEVFPRPVAPAIKANTPLCSGGTLQFTITPSQGASYRWSGPGGFQSTLQNPTIPFATTANAGRYTVEVQVPGCTPITESIDVVVESGVPANFSLSSNSPICGNTPIILTASPSISGALYVWRSPGFFDADTSRSNSYTVPEFRRRSGVYQVEVLLPGCNNRIATTTVVINDSAKARGFANATPRSPICRGDLLRLFAEGVAGARYEWVSPKGRRYLTQNPILRTDTVDASGRWLLIVTVPGCVKADTQRVDVLVNTAIDPAPVSNAPLCQGQKLVLTAAAGPVGTTYLWKGPEAFEASGTRRTVEDDDPVAGIYTVTVTVPGCSAVTRTINIQVFPSLANPVVIPSNDTLVCSGASVQLRVRTTVPNPFASYLWTGPNGFVSTDAAPIIEAVNNLQDGVYTVTVKIPGCVDYQATTGLIRIVRRPVGLAAGNNGPLCENATLNLTVTEWEGASYRWQGPAGFTSTDPRPILFAVNSANSGAYSVEVSVLGCPVQTLVTNVLVSEQPRLNLSNVRSNSPVCAGQILRFTAPFYANARYSWSGPNGFSSTQQNPVINGATINNAGRYILTVSTPGCIPSAIGLEVAVNALPPNLQITSNSPLCVGGTLRLTATGMPANATINWSGPNGFYSSVLDPLVFIADETFGGTYNASILLPGCTPFVIPTIVEVSPKPVPNARSNSPICAASRLRLTADFYPDGTYRWTGPAGFSSTEANPDFVPLGAGASGTYTVSITLPGCEAVTDTVNVVVNTPPLNVVATTNAPICTGGTLTFSVTPVVNATYVWAGPNAFAATGQNPILPNVTTVNSGEYTVTVIVPGCLPNTARVNAIVNTITGLVASSNTPICQGNTLELYATNIPGASYSWRGPSGFTSNAQNPVLLNVTPPFSGTYTLQVIVPGCTSTTTTEVIINSLPLNIRAVNNGPLCSGSTLQLGVDNVPGARYSWSGPDGFSSAFQSPSLGNVTTVNAGIYTVSVVVPGCAPVTTTTEVRINTRPMVVAGSNSPVCFGNVLNLQATTILGASYAWRGPNGFESNIQNPIISGVNTLASGIYTVSVSVPGCEAVEATTEVVINRLYTSNPILSNSPVCVGSNLSLSLVTVLPGANYSWNGPGGLTLNGANVSLPATLALAGDWILQVNSLGCSPQSYRTSVVVVAPSNPQLSYNQPLCEGSTLMLTATGVVGGARYNWSGPGGWSSTMASPMLEKVSTFNSGVYRLVIEDAVCGISEAQIPVIVTPRSTAIATPLVSNLNACAGQSVSIPVELSGQAPWSLSYSINGGAPVTVNGINDSPYNIQFVVNNPGTTLVSLVGVRDSRACSEGIARGQVTITVSPRPTIQLVLRESVDCNRRNGTLQVAVTEGSGFVYSINGGAFENTTGIFENLAPGIYTIAARNEVCLATAQFEVEDLRAVTLTSINATENSAFVAWQSVSGAQSYNLRYRVVGATSWQTIAGITSTTQIVTNLRGNTEYEFSVQAVCAGGITGPFSAPRSVRTLEPTCPRPRTPFTIQNSPTSVTVRWEEVPTAICYALSYRAVGESNWIDVLIPGTSNTSYQINNLVTGRNYEVYLRSICGSCSLTGGNLSLPSNILTFTPQQARLQSGGWVQSDVTIYPNPSNGVFQVRYVLDKESVGRVSLVDLSGKVVFEQQVYLNEGENEISLEIPQAQKGVYLLRLQVDDQVYSAKVMIE
ncbi:MAG: SBBP repeat-containing protein [Bacteroidia bacterium]|nr:SBBP repeat-containing protein [Bacteroidia bacterium]